MFESGIGPGVRSNRFGTWSLITFLLLFVTPAFHEALLFCSFQISQASTLSPHRVAAKRRKFA